MLKEIRQIIGTAISIWSSMTSRNKVALIVASIIMLFGGGLSSVPPLVLGQLVDKVFSQKDTNSLFNLALPYILAIIIAIVVREALQVLRKYLVENVATQVEKQQTIKIISHVLRLDLLSNDSKQATGSLHGLIFRGVQSFVKLIKLCYLDFFPMAFAALCALAVAMYRQPRLAAVMSFVIPFGFAIILRQISSQKGIRYDLLESKKKIDGKAVELLGEREYVRVANTESFEISKIESVAEQLRRREMKHHIAMARFDAFKYLNEGLFYVLVLCYSLFLVSRNNLTPGDVLTFSLLFNSVLMPLRELHRIIDEAHESHIHVEQMFELLNKPEDKSYKVTSVTKELSLNGNSMPLIDVRNLCFTYPNESDNGLTLDRINFSIKAGEKIGIAGESGSGKSTFLKILLRVLHAGSGELLVKGRDIESFSHEEIATNFGYVSQTPALFSGTVSENICYGCINQPSDEEIVEAARKAHIHNDIMKMDRQYESMVEERGKNLSGGQRQRIALARVFLKDPAILVLDEATSALDTHNELFVQEALAELMKDRTVITVAHRLSTLRQTDKIFVFDTGKIVEVGTYKSLENNDGIFAKLIRAASHEKFCFPLEKIQK